MWKRITKRRTLLFLAHSTVASLLPSLPTFSLFRSDVHGDTRPNQKYGVINAANLAAPRCHYDNGMQQNTYGNSRNKQRKYQRPRIVTNKKTKKKKKKRLSYGSFTIRPVPGAAVATERSGFSKRNDSRSLLESSR